jgi:cell division protein FtsB
MSKPVSRSTKTQISDGETASEMTIRSLESELNQTCTDYTRELIDLRERNSALIEHIANLRSRNKELATTEDLVWIQESQIKKMRDSETKLERNCFKKRS